MEENNPLVTLSPDIDYDLELVIKYDALGGTYTLSGSHDGFPCYEVFVGHQAIYTHDSGTQTITSLFPPQEFSVEKNDQQLHPLTP